MEENCSIKKLIKWLLVCSFNLVRELIEPILLT